MCLPARALDKLPLHVPAAALCSAAFLTDKPAIARKEHLKYPGIAQLVARVVWDHQVGGSSPSTRTITGHQS